MTSEEEKVWFIFDGIGELQSGEERGLLSMC
jgi:hypothetical protein